MMIGTLSPEERILLHTSRPLIFGSITSRMMTSGDSVVASFRPVSPSRATVTANPSYWNPSRSATAIASSSSMMRALGMFLLRRQGQADREGAPLAGIALQRHPPAVRLHDVADDRQAQAAALHVVHQAR